MAFTGDGELLQDFLTETAELIEQLDGDLVRLERVTPGSEEATQLLNSIFRALHTVKGAAGFLGLTTVTTFAHAAEDALNRLRHGEAQVTPVVMDALLRSVDVLRSMTGALAAGEEPPLCPADLLEALHAVGTKTDASLQSNKTTVATSDEAASCGTTHPLELPEQKRELLSFMIDDWRSSTEQFDACLRQLEDQAQRSQAAEQLAQLSESLARTADFFELDAFTTLLSAVHDAATRLGGVGDHSFAELLIRLRAVHWLMNEQTTLLEHNRVGLWPVQGLAQHIADLAAGQPLNDEKLADHRNDVRTLLTLEGVLPSDNASAGASESTSEPAQTVNDNTNVSDARSTAGRHSAAPEATIRVEVGRLEALMNLVGQLVLTKNRMLALSRRLRELEAVAPDLSEEVAASAGDLDRLTSELQVGVMRTRMQPLSKLFDRYPRVIRDMARITGKQINLEIIGKETEVDKSVLELLGDPLIHILRNSADHGIEPPEVRRAAGKPEAGCIRLSAEHQGSHVLVQIIDDGRGISRELVGRKAVERGLTTEEKLATMSDSEVFQFIFAAGFSTAEKVSDLSGRGVGMDVVRTNVTKMNGVINVSSVPGKSTRIDIMIPLTVAIMPAMVVQVKDELYCVPLQSIVEIVRPETTQLHSIKGRPVMRLRDSVLPLVDLDDLLRRSPYALPSREGQAVAGTIAPTGRRCAVVVCVGEQRAGLLVDRLIGQQEIVVKPLDDQSTHGGPFSGATIREDGQVSLILDVGELLRQAGSTVERKAA